MLSTGIAIFAASEYRRLRIAEMRKYQFIFWTIISARGNNSACWAPGHSPSEGELSIWIRFLIHGIMYRWENTHSRYREAASLEVQPSPEARRHMLLRAPSSRNTRCCAIGHPTSICPMAVEPASAYSLCSPVYTFHALSLHIRQTHVQWSHMRR